MYSVVTYSCQGKSLSVACAGVKWLLDKPGHTAGEPDWLATYTPPVTDAARELSSPWLQ